MLNRFLLSALGRIDFLELSWWHNTMFGFTGVVFCGGAIATLLINGNAKILHLLLLFVGLAFGLGLLIIGIVQAVWLASQPPLARKLVDLGSHHALVLRCLVYCYGHTSRRSEMQVEALSELLESLFANAFPPGKIEVALAELDQQRSEGQIRNSGKKLGYMEKSDALLACNYFYLNLNKGSIGSLDNLKLVELSGLLDLNKKHLPRAYYKLF